MRAVAAQREWMLPVLLGAVGLAIPYLTADLYLLTVLGSALLFGVLAMSLDLLWGYSGILNLAPALSFGVGAYTWGIVTSRIDGTSGAFAALVAVLVLPALLAALVAFVAFRSGAKDIFFALITLALMLAVQQVVQIMPELTGGSNGLLGIAWPSLGIPYVGAVTVDSLVGLYQLSVVMTAVVLWFCLRLMRSRFGVVLRAVRESDQRAETLGYSTLGHRVSISMVSASVAGFAGMLYASTIGIVDPSIFGVALSIQVFVWVAVGGAGTLIGPLLAAVTLTTGQATLAGSSATGYLMATGIAFILIVLLLPGGLASLPKRLSRGGFPLVEVSPATDDTQASGARP